MQNDKGWSWGTAQKRSLHFQTFFRHVLSFFQNPKTLDLYHTRRFLPDLKLQLFILFCYLSFLWKSLTFALLPVEVFLLQKSLSYLDGSWYIRNENIGLKNNNVFWGKKILGSSSQLWPGGLSQRKRRFPSRLPGWFTVEGSLGFRSSSALR